MATKAVLFDIDGTIIDTWDFVFKAIKHSLSFHGYTLTDEKIKEAMGRPLVEFYKYILPKVDPNILAETHHNFQSDKFDLGKPFPKVKKVLKKLKSSNFKIAAVSNRTKKSLLKSLKEGGIEKYFDVVVSMEDVENPKPHKDHPLKALELLQVEAQEAIMVGDTDIDILAGKSAGVKTVGVTYGFFLKNIKSHKPDFVIDDLEELLKVLKYH